MSKSARYFFIGDIHGSIFPISLLTDYFGREELNKTDNYLILLGDAGINFYNDIKDTIFKTRLQEYPFTYFCIRGNHEERPSNLASKYVDTWDIESFFNGAVLVEEDFPKIKYALDYPSAYNIAGFSTLVIPGAYSVDKHIRLRNNWPWFEDEQLSESEMKIALKLLNKKKFNLILSHTCPAIYEPTDLFLPSIDQSLVDKSMERFLGSVECTYPYDYWLWGHYHKYRKYPNNKCFMLDQYSVMELKDNKFETHFINT